MDHLKLDSDWLRPSANEEKKENMADFLKDVVSIKISTNFLILVIIGVPLPNNLCHLTVYVVLAIQERRLRRQGLEVRARLVLNWALTQSFKFAKLRNLKIFKAKNQPDPDSISCPPQLIEILDDEVCTTQVALLRFSLCIEFYLFH